MSGIVSGLIGGAVALAITAAVSRRVGRGGEPGSLKFGFAMWALAALCGALSALPAYAIAAQGINEPSNLTAALILVIGFGIATIYAVGEALFVYGSYDEDQITFSTPWTGTKSCTWKDLEEAEYSANWSWYVLSFNNGRKIRLSKFLIGHQSALEAGGLVEDET